MMRPNLFWLDDHQWQQIEPHLPTDVRGKDRADDRRVISGILHVLRSGCRCKRIVRRNTVRPRRSTIALRGGPNGGIWEKLFRELAVRGRSSQTQMIDLTHIKAHRSASGGKGGEETGDWPLSRLAQHEDPRTCRCLKAVFFPSC